MKFIKTKSAHKTERNNFNSFSLMLKIEFATQTHTYDCYYVISRSKTKKKSIEIQQPPKKPKSIKKSNFFLLNSDFYIWKKKTNNNQQIRSLCISITNVDVTAAAAALSPALCSFLSNNNFNQVQQPQQMQTHMQCGGNQINGDFSTPYIKQEQYSYHNWTFITLFFLRDEQKQKQKQKTNTQNKQTIWNIDRHIHTESIGIAHHHNLELATSHPSFLSTKKKNLWQARCLLTFLCEE